MNILLLLMNNNNNLVRIFGYNSFLILILFDLFLIKNEDSNKSSDILNLILSCRIMYATCNIFVSRRRVQLSKIIKFDENKSNLINRLLYDSNNSIDNKLIKFTNLKELTFGICFNQELKKG